MSAFAGAERHYVFQGREITLPVVVRDAASAAATYLVSAAAARRLLPSSALDVVELLPGRALFSVACIDYRDNDLGDYNEVSLALFVRERRVHAGIPGGIPYLGAAVDFARSRLATYIYRLPVDQTFTCEAGRGVWGFPKTVEQIDFTAVGERRRCTLTMGGRQVLTLSVTAGGVRTLPDTPMVTYSMIGGALHCTRFVSGAHDVGIHVGGADLTLGDHPLADELRALGLPRRALASVWMEHSHARFEGPERV